MEPNFQLGNHYLQCSIRKKKCQVINFWPLIIKNFILLLILKKYIGKVIWFMMFADYLMLEEQSPEETVSLYFKSERSALKKKTE